MMYDYQSWYALLEKPFFAPAPWVFGFAWGIIYPLIAIAFGVTLYLFFKKQIPRFLLYVFVANMIGNFLFTPIQIGLQNNVLASLDILFIVGSLAFFEWKIWPYSKIVFALLVPYLLWGTFATVLLLTITYLNW